MVHYVIRCYCTYSMYYVIMSFSDGALWLFRYELNITVENLHLFISLFGIDIIISNSSISYHAITIYGTYLGISFRTSIGTSHICMHCTASIAQAIMADSVLLNTAFASNGKDIGTMVSHSLCSPAVISDRGTSE